ncbi:MAG: sugar phosphate isomerase/epimerase family protein [Granulosicoccus sp.]
MTESLKPQETNLVLTAPDVRRILDEVDSSNLKTTLDTGAMAIAGEEPEDHFDLYGDTIIHCHFVDAVPRSVSHLAWGDGELPMEKYLHYMDGQGFNGLLTLEMTAGRYGLNPKLALEQSVSLLKAVLE